MVQLNLFPNAPPSIDEEVARLRLHLRHLTLSELEEKNILKRTSDERVVKRGSRFEEQLNELRRNSPR
jgi:hypothetical protein